MNTQQQNPNNQRIELIPWISNVDDIWTIIFNTQVLVNGSYTST